MIDDVDIVTRQDVATERKPGIVRIGKDFTVDSTGCIGLKNIRALGLKEDIDLNDVREAGHYYFNYIPTIKNAPERLNANTWGKLEVVEQDNGLVDQRLVSDGNFYFRQQLPNRKWSSWKNMSTGVEAYSLPVADSKKLGGVKIGKNIHCNDDGTIYVDDIPMASKDIPGVIRLGDYLMIDPEGFLTLDIDEIYRIMIGNDRFLKDKIRVVHENDEYWFPYGLDDQMRYNRLAILAMMMNLGFLGGENSISCICFDKNNNSIELKMSSMKFLELYANGLKK